MGMRRKNDKTEEVVAGALLVPEQVRGAWMQQDTAGVRTGLRSRWSLPRASAFPVKDGIKSVPAGRPLSSFLARWSMAAPYGREG